MDTYSMCIRLFLELTSQHFIPSFRFLCPSHFNQAGRPFCFFLSLIPPPTLPTTPVADSEALAARDGGTASLLLCPTSTGSSRLISRTRESHGTWSGLPSSPSPSSSTIAASATRSRAWCVGA